MTGERNRRILVIDDNEAIHQDFRKILSAERQSAELAELEAELLGSHSPSGDGSNAAKGLPQVETYELDSANQGEAGYQLVRRSVELQKRYALAFVDMRMPPGWDGLQTIQKIWEVDSDIQIVICTAYSDYSWDELFKRFGTMDRLLILKKPFDMAEVCQLACALTEKWHLAKHAHLKLNQLTGMVNEQTRELESSNKRLLEEVEQRKLSEDRYRLVETGANDGLWDWNLLTGRVYYSNRWKAMLGHSDGEVGDSVQEWIDRVHPDDLPRMRADQTGHFERRCSQLRGEYRFRHKDGTYLWMLCRGVAVHDATGRAVRAAGSLSDITDRRMAEEQLRFDAQHDALTGLANRSQLTVFLGQCLARLKRDPKALFAVLFMDLDRFKLINDSLGHIAGDRLLVEVGRRLATCIREVDSLSRPAPDHLARIGGDEFVILLDQISHDTDALRVADRIHRALAEPFVIEGHQVSTHVSIGIAVGGSAEQQADDLLRDADTALYQAKSSGRACTQLFDPAMHDRAMNRWRTENELRSAIEDDQLTLYYQPILSSAGEELVGLEALVRWQHPVRELLGPDKFIPIAEETGLILPLGSWVLRQACRQLRKWHVQFPSMQHLSVSVNISNRQFALSNIADEIQKILAESRLSPRSLRLEITETAAMGNANQTIETISKLNAMGTLTDVDDFGTGYSSLSYLHRMPIHALKIDRGFVIPMPHDVMNRSIVHAITTLAHSLKLRVVAEGVETQEHLNAVRELGCDFAQGYHISRPMPLDQTTLFISQHARQPLAASG